MRAEFPDFREQDLTKLVFDHILLAESVNAVNGKSNGLISPREGWSAAESHPEKAVVKCIREQTRGKAASICVRLIDVNDFEWAPMALRRVEPRIDFVS